MRVVTEVVYLFLILVGGSRGDGMLRKEHIGVLFGTSGLIYFRGNR